MPVSHSPTASTDCLLALVFWGMKSVDEETGLLYAALIVICR
ncbi:uncharacterized protein METZ01_LOCUS8272 [marine metagenome]|uniref:Uncharacterized protein n=1 Tax=marine metagenome TaxID=408172 RepID=A0A381NNM6_9ZZZZ